MADIAVSASLAIEKTGSRISRAYTVNASMTGTAYAAGVWVVGTSNETLAVGDVAAPRWVFLKNLDGTNYVEIGNNGTSYPIKLLAGDCALVPFSGTINGKANTASCRVEFLVGDT